MHGNGWILLFLIFCHGPENINMAPLPASSVALEELWDHQSYAGFVALNSAVALGVVLWDYIQLLPEERSLYDRLRGPEWYSPAPWAFVILRYSAIISAVCSVLFSSIKMSNCQLALSIGQVASIVVVASSGVLCCCRLGAIWEYKKIPLGVCAVACFVMTASWIAVATQHKITGNGLDLPFGTNCQFERLPAWSPVSYALSAAFNCLIFSMVFERVINTSTMVATNTGWTLINRACLVYMFFTAISSVGILVVYSSESSTDLLKRSSAPYLILILMSMGSRVFLNLRLHKNIITKVEESNHFTAKSWNLGESENSPQIPRAGSNVPAFNPSTAPAADVRSLGTFITSTTLTVPDTPATQTSFHDSSSFYDSPQSPRSLAATSISEVQRGPQRMDSVPSFVTASTGETDMVSEMPDIPKRVRVGSVKSSSSSTSHRTSPRRKPVPSVTSFETASMRTASTRRTGSSAPPRPPRRIERMDSFKYFATTSNLKADELKSTWHGV